ncbi:MAG: chromosomal replication initiator protein DnaA [Spirulina sp. SIO3F2]|nr:chromosomal replication initiator protein DnaA [Spirulina sp. SIO3F2]
MTQPPQQFWQAVLERLEQQLTPPTFETWIKPIEIKALTDAAVIIEVPNLFARNWLQKYYLSQIQAVVQEVLGVPREIQLMTAQEGVAPEAWLLEQPTASNTTVTSAVTQPTPISFNTKYVFAHFVVGSNNRMAHAAALAVAESPGREFNPLFLCGGVGLGKTHLMQAIGHYRIDINPDSRVFYVSTEKFTNDLITAIRQDSLEQFREHYRAADVLLVDDLQFIEGKEYTQEEFFYTFNTLHEAGKQVVLAADRPPNRIPNLQERLCSRFSMGLIADVQAPDFETRVAILQKKADAENVRLPREVIEYLATHYTSNIRELEGALTRTIAYVAISGLPMKVESIMPLLNANTNVVEVTPDMILTVITDEFKVSLDDLKSSSRRREISLARQMAMYLMREHTNLSLPRIGEVFGGKDHTTVLYSCDKLTKLRKKDNKLNQTLILLSERIMTQR